MQVIGLVGSYRKGGTIDSAMDAVLAGAAAAGAQTRKLYLIDQPISFCMNCRNCMQQPGEERGACVLHDGMAALLDAIEVADAVVLGSPMNFGTVTAVTKTFMERLACLGYWPWGQMQPEFRIANPNKTAVVIASAAAPAFIARLQSNMVPLMKKALRVLGCRVVGVLFIGMAATQKRVPLSPRTLRRAHALGRRLVQNRKEQTPPHGCARRDG